MAYYFLFPENDTTIYSHPNRDEMNTGNDEILELPKEFKSLLDNQDIIARHALAYLKKRNITKQDILKQMDKFFDEGKYKHYIISYLVYNYNVRNTDLNLLLCKDKPKNQERYNYLYYNDKELKKVLKRVEKFKKYGIKTNGNKKKYILNSKKISS